MFSSQQAVELEVVGPLFSRDEKLDLLHFWRASKVKSNMVSALFTFEVR